MAGDLAWFPLLVDDWLGGTLSMTQAELGAYLQALIGQWKSRALQAIKDNDSLISLCRGPMTPEVRSKFISIEIEGVKYLRNEKLACIYREQVARHERAVSRAKAGAQAKHKQKTSNAPAVQIPEPILSNNKRESPSGDGESVPRRGRKRSVSPEQVVLFGRRDALMDYLKAKLGDEPIPDPKKEKANALKLVKAFPSEECVAEFDRQWSTGWRDTVNWGTVWGSIAQRKARSNGAHDDEMPEIFRGAI